MSQQTLTPVDRSYGQALLDLAQDAGKLDLIAEQVADLSKLLAEDDALTALLRTPTLSREDRERILTSVFGGQLDDTLYKFVLVVSRKDRIGSLEGILAGFLTSYDAQKGRVAATLTVAQPIDDAAQAQLAQKIGAAIQKEVSLSVAVDPAILGGMTLRVGDQLVDGSIRSKLQQLQNTLAARARQYAREAAAQA